MMLMLWKKMGGGEPTHETPHPLLANAGAPSPFKRVFDTAGAARPAEPALAHPYKEQR
jgi:hypothetical protein